MKNNFKTVNVDIRDGVAVLKINHPPVNQFAPQMGDDFKQAITEAFADETIKAVILTGTGKNFIAGADITQLQLVKSREDVFEIAHNFSMFLSTIEDASKPVIAAINGNCLGAGLETAMVCHYRVAVPNVNLGLPEVKIGLIPGAGGTQRLPRLIGLPNAIQMITTGNPIKSEKAFMQGLVDLVASQDQLLEKAFEAAHQFISGKLTLAAHTTRNINERLPSDAEKTALINFSRSAAMAKGKGYIAPFKAIDAFEQGLKFDIVADLKKEVELFIDCAMTDVSKNLIGMFLNTRAAGKLPRIKGLKPAKITKVAMLGGGVMGSGIVNLMIKSNISVVLWDINDQAVEKGMSAIRKTFDYPVKKRKITQKAVDTMIETHVSTTTSLEDTKDVDLVIEAVLENMDVKQKIWKQLESICRPEVVFGTNTSALPITEMATILSDPGRMIGLHFFNPADRMPLLEVICTKETSDQTLATSVAFGRTIKKVPIVVNDGPGFYVSRQLIGLLGAATFLTADGVDGGAIEEAMVDFGMPMGPAGLADLTGIDIGYHVNKTFEKELGERYAIHPLTKIIYDTGCYGRKTGSGYFDYSGKKPVQNKIVVEAVQAYLKEKGTVSKNMSREDIVDAMLALGINEAALMMEEGICDRPQDMDLAMIYGTGFPPYRGGVLRYADKWGLKKVYAKLLELEKQYGIRFQPAKLIKDMAQSEKSFY